MQSSVVDARILREMKKMKNLWFCGAFILQRMMNKITSIIGRSDVRCWYNSRKAKHRGVGISGGCIQPKQGGRRRPVWDGEVWTKSSRGKRMSHETVEGGVSEQEDQPVQPVCLRSKTQRPVWCDHNEWMNESRGRPCLRGNVDERGYDWELGSRGEAQAHGGSKCWRFLWATLGLWHLFWDGEQRSDTS